VYGPVWMRSQSAQNVSCCGTAVGDRRSLCTAAHGVADSASADGWSGCGRRQHLERDNEDGGSELHSDWTGSGTVNSECAELQLRSVYQTAPNAFHSSYILPYFWESASPY
jgi:hypothetical protein